MDSSAKAKQDMTVDDLSFSSTFFDNIDWSLFQSNLLDDLDMPDWPEWNECLEMNGSHISSDTSSNTNNSISVHVESFDGSNTSLSTNVSQSTEPSPDLRRVGSWKTRLPPPELTRSNEESPACEIVLNPSNSTLVKRRPVHVQGIPAGMLAAYEFFTPGRPPKRLKLSKEQVQNRKRVGSVGGQCLNCKMSRSKVRRILNLTYIDHSSAR